MAREIRVNEAGDAVAVRSNHPADSTLAWGVLTVNGKGVARGAWGKDADISQWSDATTGTGAREIRVSPDGDQAALRGEDEDWDWAVLSMRTTRGSRPEGKRLADDAEVADWTIIREQA